MNIVQLLFNAKGRIRRRDYWLALIAVLAFNMIVSFIGHQLITGNPPALFLTEANSWITYTPTPFNLFQWGVMVVFLWPLICIEAKRWHDRNRPGWLAGLLTFTHFVLELMLWVFEPGTAEDNFDLAVGYGAQFLTVGIAFWQFIELGCLEGTKGPNKYGPSPKGIGSAPNVF